MADLFSKCRQRNSSGVLMSETRSDVSDSHLKDHEISGNLNQPSTTQDTSDGCFHDISLSPSVTICRICHCSGEEEELIQPCRCNGSVRYAHETCIRKWIVGSANFACELCHYKFKTKAKRILDIRKIRFPRPSFKGWLHILLFLAFFSIMLTSLTWIMWSQLSTSRAAKSERESKEVTYAYAVNGGFIVMALIGLYLDSFGQCRKYYRKWSLLNQELIVFPYDANGDVDYYYKTAGFLFMPHKDAANCTPKFHVNDALAVSTPDTSAINKSESTDDTTTSLSYLNDGFAHDKQTTEVPMGMHSDATSNRDQWPVTDVSVPSHSITEQATVRQSASLPDDLRNILVLRETYV